MTYKMTEEEEEEDKNIKMILLQCNDKTLTYNKAKQLLQESEGNVVTAIIKSMGLNQSENEKNKTFSDLTVEQKRITELRKILDEKDVIFRDKMSS